MKFYVQNKKSGTKSFSLNSHDKPREFPSCVLVHNDGWNDYSSWTWFSVFYYEKDEEPIYLGDIKLMHSYKADTCKVIGSCFDEPLDDNFCSLGLQTSYYYNLVKEITDRDVREEILRFLRDCTFDKRIYEKYRDHPRFKESLIRDMSSQEALEAAEFILNSDDL